MGEKVAAQRASTQADGPRVPGSAEPVTSGDQIRAFGARHDLVHTDHRGLRRSGLPAPVLWLDFNARAAP
jgi:hypothetical protein